MTLVLYPEALNMSLSGVRDTACLHVETVTQDKQPKEDSSPSMHEGRSVVASLGEARCSA